MLRADDGFELTTEDEQIDKWGEDTEWDMYFWTMAMIT